MAYDQATRHAVNNLANQLQRVDAGEVGTDAIRIAAEAVVRVMSPEAVEDREYYTDLSLPRSEKCLATGEFGRVCGRRYGHVSKDHRDCEISWTGDLREPKEGSRVRSTAPGYGGQLEGTVIEITREGGRTEYMVDLGDIELGFQRHELEVIA